MTLHLIETQEIKGTRIADITQHYNFVGTDYQPERESEKEDENKLNERYNQKTIEANNQIKIQKKNT